MKNKMKQITSNIIITIHSLINTCQALTPCYSKANNDEHAQSQGQGLLSYCRMSEAIMRGGQMACKNIQSTKTQVKK